MIHLSEKGVFLKDSYYIEAEPEGYLTKTEKRLLALLQDYQNKKQFSAERLCVIFELARDCNAQRKGNLAKKECYYVSEIESLLEQRESGTFQIYRWKGLPSEVQSRINFLAGDRATVYMGDKRVYIFLKPGLETVWKQCTDSMLGKDNLEIYCKSLLQERKFARELPAKCICEFKLLFFQLRPGIRRICQKKEPVFYGIPLNCKQEPVVFSYQEYQDLYLENSSSVQVLENGGICFKNRMENLRFVEEIYRNFGKPEQWEDRRFPVPDNNKWDRIENTCGLCLEGGWPCKVHVEQGLNQRMALVRAEIREKDFIILLTDEERVERWKRIFPDFYIYTQRTLEESFFYRSQEADGFSGIPSLSHKDNREEWKSLISYGTSQKGRAVLDDTRREAFIFRNQDSFGLFIWDAKVLSEENQSFLTFLLRFLPLRKELLFLYPENTENVQILEKMGEVFFQTGLKKQIENEIRAMQRLAEEQKAVLELSFTNSEKQIVQLLGLLKKQEVPVGIWTETEQTKHSQRVFLDKYFPNQYAEPGDMKAEDEKWIFLVDSSNVYQEALNHYLVFDGEFCAAHKRKIICQGQSQGMRAIICMYHLS